MVFLTHLILWLAINAVIQCDVTRVGEIRHPAVVNDRREPSGSDSYVPTEVAIATRLRYVPV